MYKYHQSNEISPNLVTLLVIQATFPEKDWQLEERYLGCFIISVEAYDGPYAMRMMFPGVHEPTFSAI